MYKIVPPPTYNVTYHEGFLWRLYINSKLGFKDDKKIRVYEKLNFSSFIFYFFFDTNKSLKQWKKTEKWQ